MAVNSIYAAIERVVLFLEPYLPIANCHMVDFITNDHWNNLVPHDIKSELDVLSESIYESRLPYTGQFVSAAQNHTLQGLGMCTNLADCAFLCEGDTDWRRYDTCMSEKKAHEVEVMSPVVNGLVGKVRATVVVDIGSGKGYLSTFLSIKNGLRVMGIDSSVVNTSGDEKRAGKLQRIWGGADWASSDNYKRVTSYVTDRTDLPALVSSEFGDHPESMVLVGLHTCGNLGPHMLRLFARCKEAKGMCVVGCCYHLLDEEFELPEFWKDHEASEGSGFPMSKYAKEKRCCLGRNARMLAAQPLERIRQLQSVPSKSLFYRALLQVVLRENYGDQVAEFHVGRIAAKSKDFPDYLRRAMDKLKLKQPEGVDATKLLEQYLPYQKKLDLFFQLRTVLAPVIEGLILLDRLAFLLEDDSVSEAHLVRLFDPVTSPRCYGITATKSTLL